MKFVQLALTLAMATINAQSLSTYVVINPTEAEISGAGAAPINTGSLGLIKITLSSATVPSTMTLDYNGFSAFQPSGRAIAAAHIHGAATAGSTGDVLISLFVSNAFVTSAPIADATTLATILSGRAYVNVHSALVPNGELRAQILFGKNAIGILNQFQVYPRYTVVSDYVFGSVQVLYTEPPSGVVTAPQVFTWAMRGGFTSDPTSFAVYTNGAPGVQGTMACNILASITSGNTTFGTASCYLPVTFGAQLAAGTVYVQVATATNPNGEVRAQLVAPDSWVPNVDAGTSGLIKATLNGASSVPAVVSSGVGSFIGAPVLNTTSGLASLITFGTVASLSTGMANAHIHGPSGPASTSGVVMQLPYRIGTTAASFAYFPAILVSGTGARDALCENSYINVHTSGSPNGEIRGQTTRRVGVSSGGICPYTSSGAAGVGPTHAILALAVAAVAVLASRA